MSWWIACERNSDFHMLVPLYLASNKISYTFSLSPKKELGNCCGVVLVFSFAHLTLTQYGWCGTPRPKSNPGTNILQIWNVFSKAVVIFSPARKMRKRNGNLQNLTWMASMARQYVNCHRIRRFSKNPEECSMSEEGNNELHNTDALLHLQGGYHTLSIRKRYHI